MDRRSVLKTGLLAAVLPGMLRAATGAEATPEEVILALAGNKTVFLSFTGKDCKACKVQAKVVETLQANSPGLAEAVNFMAVDFDANAESPLVAALKVERPGTLIVLKREREFGRLVGEIETGPIRDLVETAYKVATG